ncbi:MAG TPA: hypothetical protein VD768_00480 [Sphingomicrobium sp.]|nr:hypothetical protein [Sphingomicrobium sp.]
MDPNSDFMVGCLAAVLVFLIGWRIVRGLRAGRLPVYRTYIGRDENRAKFNMLLALHIASMMVVATIAADLLFGLNLRGR